MEYFDQFITPPLYTLYLAGYPSKEVFFYERAAAELNINLKVEFHGCCIDSKVDENGIETNTAEYKSRKYKDQNLIAKQYYDQTYGENWLDQVRKRSSHLLNVDQYTKLVDQYTMFEIHIKKELKSKIITTIILNILFFFSLWAIFNIYFGIIVCAIFTLVIYFLITKKYKRDSEFLDDLKFKIENFKI